ncbi:hypothetical protein K440DRAFT_646594 [Wilcoxina mikolae CBS 423.85]|nr:hypothetical protein K440DRAFT_646594 [Wilcoxina mikolae CBS 423.85]
MFRPRYSHATSIRIDATTCFVCHDQNGGWSSILAAHQFPYVSARHIPNQMMEPKIIPARAPSSAPGAFAITAKFPNVPNPGLSMAGLGTIGLRLSQLDEFRIIAATQESTRSSALGSTGKEETVGSKLTFRNERFNTWLQEVTAHRVCPTLGIEDAEDVQVQFSQMLLYPPSGTLQPLHGHAPPYKPDMGGQVPTLNSSAKGNSTRKFGPLIAVLPSKFEGGELQLRKSKSLFNIDDEHRVMLALQSEFETGLAAWLVLTQFPSLGSNVGQGFSAIPNEVNRPVRPRSLMTGMGRHLAVRPEAGWKRCRLFDCGQGRTARTAGDAAVPSPGVPNRSRQISIDDEVHE